MPSLSIAVRNRAKEIDTGHIYVPRPQVQHDNRLHKDCEKLPPFLPITSPDHSRLLPIHGVHPVDEKQHFIGPSKAKKIDLKTSLLDVRIKPFRRKSFHPRRFHRPGRKPWASDPCTWPTPSKTRFTTVRILWLNELIQTREIERHSEVIKIHIITCRQDVDDQIRVEQAKEGDGSWKGLKWWFGNRFLGFLFTLINNFWLFTILQ